MKIENANGKYTTPARKFATLCGRIFRDTDPQYFPNAQHRGRTLRFCTEACLGAFIADPDIFCKVHRNSEKKTVESAAEGGVSGA